MSLALTVVLSLCLSLSAVGWFVVRFVSLACIQGCVCVYVDVDMSVCVCETNLGLFRTTTLPIAALHVQRTMYGEFEKAFMASETQRKYG